MANRKKFTATWIPSAPPGEHFDASSKGLGLRVSPKGKRTWFIRVHLRGRQVRRKLGEYPEVGLKQARDTAAITWGEAKAGTLEVEPKAAPLPFKEAGERALEEVLSLKTRERTVREYRRIFTHDLVPAWGGRTVDSITRSDVAALAAKVAGRGSPIMANRVLGFARLLWNAMMDLELAPSNPAARPKRFMREEKPRERALSKEELKKILTAAGAEAPEARAFLLLVAYTGQRAGAVAAARWTEFDIEEGTWRIPAAEGRKFRGHDRLLPLSDGAVRALRILLEEAKPHPEYLFPARSGAKHDTFRGWHNLVRRLRKRAGVDGWSIHTLRATFRGLSIRQLQIRGDVADLVLGHTVATTGHRFYEADKLTFGLEEKRKALDAWSAFLDGLATDTALLSSRGNE